HAGCRPDYARPEDAALVRPAVRYLLSTSSLLPGGRFPARTAQEPGFHGAPRLMGEPIRRLGERTRGPEPRQWLVWISRWTHVRQRVWKVLRAEAGRETRLTTG